MALRNSFRCHKPGNDLQFYAFEIEYFILSRSIPLSVKIPLSVSRLTCHFWNI